MSDVLGWVTTWYNHWMGLTPWQHLLNVFWGALGACFYIARVNPPMLKLPEWNRETGSFRLNNLVGPLSNGAMVAFLIGDYVPVSLLAGAIGPKLLELVNRVLIPGILRAIPQLLLRMAAGSSGYYDYGGYGGYGSQSLEPDGLSQMDPFDSAQGGPFDSAQGGPFDSAQGRPGVVGEVGVGPVGPGAGDPSMGGPTQ